MIVRARTPKSLSWAGRIAVFGMAALFLPLTAGWAQKDTAASVDVNRATRVAQPKSSVEARIAQDLERDGELADLAREIKLISKQLTGSRDDHPEWIESMGRQLEKVRDDIGVKRRRLGELTAKSKIDEELERHALSQLDSDIRHAIKQRDERKHNLDHIKQVIRHPNDPAKVAAEKEVEKLEKQCAELQRQKYWRIRDLIAKRHENNDGAFEATYLALQVEVLMKLEDQVRKNLEQLKFESSQEKSNPALAEQARAAAKEQLSHVEEQSENLRKAKQDRLAAMRADDDKAKDDKDKETKQDEVKEKARDAGEHFQEQLQELIGKLGKQFAPVTEEVRKALDRAVGEVHQSLDKENLSVDDLRKALEKSQEELKKAFEEGGPVNKELREAIEKSRNELEEALERGKAEVQGQVESLRERSRELTDQAREQFERAREAAEKGLPPGDMPAPERAEIEAARREIRELEQQLRRSTRRLEELLKRQDVPRGPAPRRERIPREAARPRTSPAIPKMRRPQPPRQPGPAAPRREPQGNSERRIQELEEKMKSLLKELEDLKEEKTPTDKSTAGSQAPGLTLHGGQRLLSAAS